MKMHLFSPGCYWCLLEIGLCMDLSLMRIVAIIIFADFTKRPKALVLAMA